MINATNVQNILFLDEMERKRTIDREALDRLTASNPKGELRVRMEGLRSRMGFSTPDNALQDRLVEAARSWKEGYSLYEKKEVTDAEKAVLKELTGYSEFAQIVLDDAQFRGECFKLILRDRFPVEALVKYPATCKRLKRAQLASRIGRFASTSLKVENNDLTLPFDGKRVSILDGKTEVLGTTLDKIFQVFQEKNDRPGNFEYFGEKGIIPFHVQKFEIKEGDWWTELPVYEILSKDEVQKRFNINELEDDGWVASARASTQTLGMDIDQSHGFLEVALPLKDGRWRIYNFGKFAEQFPSKLIKKIFMIGNTVKAKISYVDENDFYSHRSQARAPIKLTEAQGLKLMEEIGKDIKRAEEGNIVFQFAWENCAYWPQDKLKTILGDLCPNFFLTHTSHATPTQPVLKALFTLIKKVKGVFQKAIFRCLEVILGGWRGVYINGGEYKCVWGSPFHDTQEMFHPARLHQQIRRREIEGVITFGYLNQG